MRGAPVPPSGAPSPVEAWRDWAGALPAEAVAHVAGQLAAAEARGHGPTLMALACKGWRHALKRDAVARAGGPAAWRDWGNRFGEGLPAEVLLLVAETLVARAEAEWAAHLKRRLDWGGHNRREEYIATQMARWKAEGNCLFVFALVCKGWRRAQLKVGGRLRTRATSDVVMPGRVALAKWALAEGCPRAELYGARSMAGAAAGYGHLELVRWLVQEQDFAMDPLVMRNAAHSGNLDLVQWLRAEGCKWDVRTSAAAAWRGKLEVLQWLRANGCPWNHWVCLDAVDNSHVEVLRWARENGCPWSALIRDRAAAELGYTDDLGNVGVGLD